MVMNNKYFKKKTLIKLLRLIKLFIYLKFKIKIS